MSTVTNSWNKGLEARSGGTAKSLAMPAKREKSRNDVVRDNWEDDDEEEDDDPVAVEERNRQIWDEANSRESRPMPSVVISRGFSIHSASSNLPLNEPPAMRILKRPSPSTDVSSNLNTTIGKSLQDREARYVAARERIFGTPTSDDPTEEMRLQNHSGKIPSLSSASIPSQVIRELRGPNLGDGTNSSSMKGFVYRRSKNAVPPPSKLEASEDTS